MMTEIMMMTMIIQFKSIIVYLHVGLISQRSNTLAARTLKEHTPVKEHRKKEHSTEDKMRQTSMPMMIMMIRNTRTKGIAITKK
jgi:hypothetical protein